MAEMQAGREWWDAQGINNCLPIDEFGMQHEVAIYRVELELVDEGNSGYWMSPPEPPSYAPKFEEWITVRPVHKWYGRTEIPQPKESV